MLLLGRGLLLLGHGLQDGQQPCVLAALSFMAAAMVASSLEAAARLSSAAFPCAACPSSSFRCCSWNRSLLVRLVASASTNLSDCEGQGHKVEDRAAARVRQCDQKVGQVLVAEVQRYKWAR